MPKYQSQRYDIHCLAAYYRNKASREISGKFLQEFSSKGKKSAKKARIVPNYAN